MTGCSALKRSSRKTMEAMQKDLTISYIRGK